MKVQYYFLTIDELLHIHDCQIKKFGGSPGLRDGDLLDSALGAVYATFEGTYLHRDIFEMAAAYLCGIVKNHPFVDGNKRTGVAAALLFLRLNGYEINASSDEIYSLGMAVAMSRISFERVVDFFRSHADQI